MRIERSCEVRWTVHALTHLLNWSTCGPKHGYHSSAGCGRRQTGVMHRCLFCRTESGKRSNEHVFREAFKSRFPATPGLTFSWRSPVGEFERVERPISQFDMTLNAICRECNQGWLESLEDEATEVSHELTVGNSKPALSEREVRVQASGRTCAHSC